MGFLSDIFSGGDTPNAPNYKPLTKMQKKFLKEELIPLFQTQVGYADSTIEGNQEMMQQMWAQQAPIMDEMFNAWKTDRARYEDVFVPLQDQIIEYAQNYDTPEKRAQEAAKRAADVSASFDAERANAQRNLESYGVDPSQTRQQALDLDIRAKEAAAQAGAAQEGRDYVEQMGVALRGQAEEMGRGLPTQALAAGQLGAGIGANLMKTDIASDIAGGQLYGMAVPTAGAVTQGIGNWGNLLNTSFANQLGEWGANRQNTQDIWGGIKGLIETGADIYGALADGGTPEGAPNMYADGNMPGGAIPAPSSAAAGVSDRVPAMVSEGEYVVPADVVRAKGTEFFDKLTEKYHVPAEIQRQQQRAAAIPQLPAGGPPTYANGGSAGGDIMAYLQSFADPNAGTTKAWYEEGGSSMTHLTENTPLNMGGGGGIAGMLKGIFGGKGTGHEEAMAGNSGMAAMFGNGPRSMI